MRICALVIGACVIWSCSSRGSRAAQRRTEGDTAGRRDSVAGVAAGTMDESQVLGLLSATNASDSALGVLGGEKGSTPAIKDFGRMVAREHHGLRREVDDVAAQLGIQPTPPQVAPDTPPGNALARLGTGAPGVAWDRAYLEYALAVHSASMENAARALAATRRAETRELISKAVPILQKHADKARALRRSTATVAATR